MNDHNHVIRVIIQGYDRLSNVLKDAATKGGASLNDINKRFAENKRQADAASKSVGGLTDALDRQEIRAQRAARRIDRLNEASQRLLRTNKELAKTQGPTTPGQRLALEAREFLRRGLEAREANAPQISAGRGVSVSSAQESDVTGRLSRIRRSIINASDAIRQQESLVGRLGSAYKKLHLDTRLVIADDIARGLKTGFEHSTGIGKDTIQQRLKDARNHKEIQLRELRRQEQEESLILERQRDEERSRDDEDDERKRQRIVRNQRIFEDEKNRALALKRIELDSLKEKEAAELELRKIKIQGDHDADLLKAQSDARSTSKKKEADRLAAREKIRLIKLEIKTEIEEAVKAHTEKFRLQEEAFAKEAQQTKRAIEDNERAKMSSLRQEISERKKAFDSETKERLLAIKRAFDVAKRQIPDAPTEAAVIQEFQQERTENIRQLPFVERQAARVGRAFGDMKKGLDGGRRGLREFTDEAGRAQTRIAQFAAGIGKATSNISQFVNVRWLLIIGLLQTFLSIIIQVGAALVAIGASAVMAAAGLGGAFLAAVSQALPVVGLLAAAMSRLESAMKVVQLRQQEEDQAENTALIQARSRTNAIDALSDAHYNLKRAIDSVADSERGIRDAREGVADAIKDQKQAVKDLATAHREAAQAIVDSSLEAKDAQLSVREAELGVLDAKKKLKDFEDAQRRSASEVNDAKAQLREAQDRLKIAESQGNLVEIAAARSAVSVAKSNVRNLKDQIAEASGQQRELKLDVERAQLTEQQAIVKRNRAIQENKKRRAEGVEGSPEVKAAKDQLDSANKNLRNAVEGVQDALERHKDAVHSVIIANREVARSQTNLADTIAATSAKQRQSAIEWAKLSPVERQFVLAIERIQDKWKKATGPVTDILISAVTRGLNRVSLLLDDPKIVGAFETLANVVADIADSFTKWLVTPEARQFLITFITNAAENLPIIASAAGKFALALARISVAAAPVFTHILKSLDGVSSKFDGATGNAGKLRDFFKSTQPYIDGWGELLGAVLGFLAALTGASASQGLEMLKDITKAFDGWTTSINEDPEGVQNFFKRIHDSLRVLLPVIGTFIGKLVKAFTSPEFNNFTIFVLEVMIPAFLDMIMFLGILAGAFADLFKVPVVGPLLKMIVHFGLVYVAMKRLFPIITGLKGFFGIKKFLIILALVEIYQNWDKISAAMDRVKQKFDKLPGWLKPVVAILGGGVGALGLAGILLLVVGRFRVLNALTNPMPGRFGKIAQALAGPRGLIGLMGRAGLAGAIALASIELGKLIRKIPGWDSFFKRAGENLFDKLQPGGGGGWGRSLDRKVLGRIGLGGKENEESDVVDKLQGNQGAIGYILSAYKKYRNAGMSHFAAIRTLEERFPNVGQGISLLIPDTWMHRQKFQGGGTVKGQSGEPVSIVAHAGEWILNKQQQIKASSAMGRSIDQARNFLFGGGSDAKDRRDVRTVPYSYGRSFDLVAQKDEAGIDVWFLKLRNGTWGQVSDKAAKKIQASKGTWLPNYIKRAQGMNNPRYWQNMRNEFASGGVVFASPTAQSFAAGGVVSSPSGSRPGKAGNIIHQTFDVKTEGDSDWHHIMKVASIAAQEGY